MFSAYTDCVVMSVTVNLVIRDRNGYQGVCSLIDIQAPKSVNDHYYD